MEEKEKMKLDSKVDIEALIEDIKTYIYENHKQDITGEILQETLVNMAKETGVVYEELLEGVANADKNLTEAVRETTDKFEKVDTSISNINIRETETSKEIDNIKNALRDVTSGKDNGQVTGGKVINIPTQATNSVAGYKIGGLTATQLVVNGDFSDGTKGWNANVTLNINNGVVNATTTSKYGQILRELNMHVGDIYYLNIPNDCAFDKVVFFYNGFSVVSSPIKNQSTIFTSNTAKSYVGLQNLNDTGVKINFNFNYIKLINLTALFGAGNEPTKEWCDEHFPEYFDGTKSVKTPLRLSCGDSKMFINSELELKKGDVIKDGVLNGKKLSTSGTLVTKPDSKVVVDYAKNSTLLYQKGLKIDDIKTLDVLQKFEADGSITSLDVAKATYTEKVLTHPELKDLDVCYVEYIYDNGVYGNNTITYGIDKFITDTPLISPDGRKWRKVEVATNDGILTTKLEEVK